MESLECYRLDAIKLKKRPSDAKKITSETPLIYLLHIWISCISWMEQPLPLLKDLKTFSATKDKDSAYRSITGKQGSMLCLKSMDYIFEFLFTVELLLTIQDSLRLTETFFLTYISRGITFQRASVSW